MEYIQIEPELIALRTEVKKLARALYELNFNPNITHVSKEIVVGITERETRHNHKKELLKLVSELENKIRED
jgi:hypothetical protein